MYRRDAHVISGRWPEKSVKFIVRLLKNAESNADAKNIDVEDLTIKAIVVQQAPVRLICVCSDRGEPIIQLCYRKLAVAHTVRTVASTLTRVTLAMLRSSFPRLKSRSSGQRTRTRLRPLLWLASTGGKLPADGSRLPGYNASYLRRGERGRCGGTRYVDCSRPGYCRHLHVYALCHVANSSQVCTTHCVVYGTILPVAPQSAIRVRCF